MYHGLQDTTQLQITLFLGGGTQEEGSIIVTYEKSAKEEVEAFLSHITIYLEHVISIVIWEAFTHDYRANMYNITFYSKKQCAAETIVNESMAYTSSIDTNDSTNFWTT